MTEEELNKKIRNGLIILFAIWMTLDPMANYIRGMLNLPYPYAGSLATINCIVLPYLLILYIKRKYRKKNPSISSKKIKLKD